MVKAVDIESLFQRYLEEDNLEKCDALYLLYTISRSSAARTLRVRYGRSGAINSVLEDLKEIGIQKVESYEFTEDTEEQVNTVVEEYFKHNCLDPILELAKERAEKLSQLSKELLYLISVMYPKYSGHINNHNIPAFYRILFQKTISKANFEKALEELCKCYVIQKVEWLSLPSYVDKILYELKEFIPKVEVVVSWQKE